MKSLSHHKAPHNRPTITTIQEGGEEVSHDIIQFKEEGGTTVINQIEIINSEPHVVYVMSPGSVVAVVMALISVAVMSAMVWQVSLFIERVVAFIITKWMYLVPAALVVFGVIAVIYFKIKNTVVDEQANLV